jgi:hypothetical protein
MSTDCILESQPFNPISLCVVTVEVTDLSERVLVGAFRVVCENKSLSVQQRMLSQIFPGRMTSQFNSLPIDDNLLAQRDKNVLDLRN